VFFDCLVSSSISIVHKFFLVLAEVNDNEVTLRDLLITVGQDDEIIVENVLGDHVSSISAGESYF
jgi:hypothetical protein